MELSHEKRMELLMDVTSRLQQQRDIMVIQDFFYDNKAIYADSKEIISKDGKVNINFYLFDDKDGRSGFSIIDNISKEGYLYNEKKAENRKFYKKEIQIYRQGKKYRHNVKFALDEKSGQYLLIDAELIDLEDNIHTKMYLKKEKIEEKDITLLAQLNDSIDEVFKYENQADDYCNNDGDKKIFEANIRKLELAEEKVDAIRKSILERYNFESSKEENEKEFDKLIEKENFLFESDDEIEILEIESGDIKKTILSMYAYSNKLIKNIYDNSKSER